MSWVHQQGSTNSNHPPPMYNPNQHSNVNNQWQSADTQNWYNPANQQQEYWQQQPQQVQQPQYAAGQNQPQAVDPQRNAPPSAHFHFNQPSQAFHQNVGQFDQQQAYGSVPYNQQQYGQGSSFVAPPQSQHAPGTQQEDSWNNWESWADEENLNVNAAPQQDGSNAVPANNLADSFSNDQSWNWSLQDHEQTSGIQQQVFREVPLQNTTQNVLQHSAPPPQPPLENKILKIRGKLDTPQWSTESQPSQESSDDILHTSESDKSHMVSRSSTISHSPVSGQEPLLPPPSKHAESTEVENKEILTSSRHELPSGPSPMRPPVQATPPLMHPPPPGSTDGVSKNPYKRNTGLSHKAANNFRTSSITPPETRPPFVLHNIPPNQPVNLETLPDNSEHPDHGAKVPSSVQPWTENNEVPINDRNQYLETGQLSQSNFLEGGDILPPPGLQRLVPGQLEQDRISGGNLNDPLPGFSRMVLGQTENSAAVSNQDAQGFFDPNGPPEGLHRMIPGESSSPETSLHQTQVHENDSEVELSQINSAQFAAQPRSATIGADTPPAGQNILSPVSEPTPLPINRSETIGGDRNNDVMLHPNAGDSIHIRGASVSSSDGRSGKTVKGSKGKEKTKGEQQSSRREFIEGQIDDNTTVSGITNSIRNLTVGENPSDGQRSSGSLPDHRTRRHSREESSDSEEDSKLQSKLPRDKRAEKSRSDKDRDREHDSNIHRDKHKERDSDRYSPDPYSRYRRDPRKSRKRDPKYEEDDEYYSDKEKERKNRGDRDRDYDRKYSSLRKEKDRGRRDRDVRDHRDHKESSSRRGGEYYYSRYGENRGFPDENRSSRPSSRSDSMHESYRDLKERERRDERGHRERRPRDKDKERDRYRPRDPRELETFNPYQSYQYDPYNPYHQQYQYYENLRRMNPQAYAEWYRKYYQSVAGGSNVSFTGDDRASVHSGRSSANDELAKDSSVNAVHNSTTFEDQTASSQRLTPAKFTTAHTKGSIASGKLVQILPNYPLDGQPASVELLNLQYLLENEEQYTELSSFPGPLVRGMTHKKTIIEYCDNKIRKAAYNAKISDVDSYVLMWELLILLIRQNGMVVGTDIAELLLKNCSNLETTVRPPSVISNASSVNQTSEASNSNIPASEDVSGSRSSLKEEEVTKKFRDHLLYGSGKEALEWAMKHGLWGHALFLASKLDKRTYANVMMRFANGLAINDPLQTLYQLLSGKMPAAVTCVSDEKWGDWRPHLAMILSNSTQRPELHRKAITILGDTLLNRGNIYAAQFCYLMAEVGFSKHDNPDTRLVLLGSDHRTPYLQFATNEAIHMTEIYEYACSLNNEGFMISEFQMYKFILATRLADVGLLEKSLAYLEKLAGYIVVNPQEVSPLFVDHVCNLADKLKFYDPVGDEEDESKFGGIMETSRPDNSWLKDLKNVQIAFQTGQITQDTTDDYMGYQQPHMLAPSAQPSQNSSWEPQPYQQEYHGNLVPPLNLQQEQPQVVQSEYQSGPPTLPTGDYINTYQEPSSLYSGEQQQFNSWVDNHQNAEGVGASQFDPEGANSYMDSPYSNNNNIEGLSLHTQPLISMPNQTKPKSGYNDEPLPHEQQQKTENAKQEVQSPKKETKQSTGWFGGIFSKLSMKPKNQMKLPDDKNPKIVWDQEKKRWINVDEDPNDPANEFKPPPKMADLMPQLYQQQPPTMTVPGELPQGIPQEAPQPTFNPTFTNGSQMLQAANKKGPSGPASLPTQPEEGNGQPKPNMFKMQRGRNLKNSYVDVFNPGGNASIPNSGPPSMLGTEKLAPMQPQMNFFVPPPVTDPNAPMDFLTPAPPMQVGEQPKDS